MTILSQRLILHCPFQESLVLTIEGRWAAIAGRIIEVIIPEPWRRVRADDTTRTGGLKEAWGRQSY